MTAPRRPRRGRGPAPAGSLADAYELLPADAVTDALLTAAGRGEVDAFSAFYDATAPVVLGLLHTVSDGAGWVERVTEEVYLTLWRGAPAFDPAARSATETLLRTARRALIGPVTDRLASPLPPSAPPVPSGPGEGSEHREETSP